MWRAGVWTDLALTLSSSVALVADAALGVTATADRLWHLAVVSAAGLALAGVAMVTWGTPLTVSPTVAWGTRIAGGVAVCVQKASVGGLASSRGSVARAWLAVLWRPTLSVPVISWLALLTPGALRVVLAALEGRSWVEAGPLETTDPGSRKEGNYLNIIKATYEKLTANTTFNVVRLKAFFFSRIRKELHLRSCWVILLYILS